MALSEERMARVLAYCKLTELEDDPEVQTLIPAFYAAAVEYLEDAGVPEPEGETGRARYDLLVNGMVLDSWERRDMTITSTVVTDNPAFRRRMEQLKRSQPPDPRTLAELGVS